MELPGAISGNNLKKIIVKKSPNLSKNFQNFQNISRTNL